MNLKDEALRVGPFALLAGLILYPDDSKMVILFGVGIILLAVLLAHGIRKLIFPYIDVKVLADKVKENAVACAMVICGLMYLLNGIIQSLVALLR